MYNLAGYCRKLHGSSEMHVPYLSACKTVLFNRISNNVYLVSLLLSELKNSDITRQGFKSCFKSWLFEMPTRNRHF